MPRFRCRACGQPPSFLEYESETGGQCPKCGRSPAAHPYQVHELTDVHFVVLDAKGPIQGSWGGQYVACQPQREYLALHGGDTFSASDYPPAVTCPACRRTQQWQGLAKLFPGLAGGMTIDGSGCCG